MSFSIRRGRCGPGRILLILAAVAVLIPEAAFSWGRNGHRVVCEIAHQRMTPPARNLVAWLQRGESQQFPETCLWADQVRETSHRETKPLHYINIPPGQTGVDLRRDCPTDACISRAVVGYAERLADASGSREERNEALKFLAHFVADVHQPLHTGRFEDRGGNDIETCFFGDCGHPRSPLTLHKVWDSRILNHGGEDWRELARGLDAAITAGDQRRWQGFDVVAWTDESYRIADTFAYPELGPEGVTEPYYQEARAHVDESLKRAAVRLAYLLDRVAAGTLDL